MSKCRECGCYTCIFIKKERCAVSPIPKEEKEKPRWEKIITGEEKIESSPEDYLESGIILTEDKELFQNQLAELEEIWRRYHS